MSRFPCFRFTFLLFRMHRKCQSEMLDAMLIRVICTQWAKMWKIVQFRKNCNIFMTLLRAKTPLFSFFFQQTAHLLWRTMRSEEIFFKNMDFSLWGQDIFLVVYCHIFPFLAPFNLYLWWNIKLEIVHNAAEKPHLC